MILQIISHDTIAPITQLKSYSHILRKIVTKILSLRKKLLFYPNAFKISCHKASRKIKTKLFLKYKYEDVLTKDLYA